MAQFFGSGKPIYGSLGYPLFGTAGKPLYSSYMVDIPPPPPPPIQPPYHPPEDDPPGPYNPPGPYDPPDPYDPYDPYDPVTPDDPYYDPDPPPEDDRRCSVSIEVDDPALIGHDWRGWFYPHEYDEAHACLSGGFSGPEDFSSALSGCAASHPYHVNPSDSIGWSPYTDLPFKWLSSYSIDIHAKLEVTNYGGDDIPGSVRAKVTARTIRDDEEPVTAYVQIPVVRCIWYGDMYTNPLECDNDAPAPKVATVNFYGWSNFANIY